MAEHDARAVAPTTDSLRVTQYLLYRSFLLAAIDVYLDFVLVGGGRCHPGQLCEPFYLSMVYAIALFFRAGLPIAAAYYSREVILLGLIRFLGLPFDLLLTALGGKRRQA